MPGYFHATPDGGAVGFASEPAASRAFFIGKIETATGSCTLTRTGDDPVQIKPGDLVCQGDIIETASGGKVCIRFIDGTVFNLSDRARMVLKEFAGDAASPSALFDISNGTFAFIAGEMVKAGRLGIDTPFAKIRGHSRTGGIGMLSLASLFFAAMEEVHATSAGLAFLDRAAIDYKDSQDFIDGKFSYFEVQVKGGDTIICCEPSETLVLRPLGSSISASRVATSLDDILAHSFDQQSALNLAAHAGPAGFGNGGSGGTPLGPTILNINFGPNGSTGPGGGGGELPPPPKVTTASVEFVPIPPPPPLVSADSNTAPSGTGNVLQNDLGATTVIHIQDADESLDVAANTTSANGTVIHGLYGTLTIGADGSYSYVVDNSNPAVIALGAGQSLVDNPFTYTATNGTTTAATTLTVTVLGTNDVPVIGGVHTSSVTEDVGVVAGNLTTSGALTITDVDQGQSNFTPQAGTAGSNGFGIFTLDAAGNWTYTANDSQAAIQQLGALQSITDSFTAVSSDGTASQVVTVTINGVNDAPVLSVAANAFYSENSPPVTLSSAATVSDLDNQNLASATVSISSGFLAGDVLNAVTTGTSITASYNPLTGVLTLTGSDTLAHYQQVLDSVTYSSTSDNPTNFGTDTSRTISWVVNDGTLPSTTQTTALSITPADDAPVLSVAANAFYSENSPPVTLSSAATVSDLDNQNLATATVSISSGFLAGDVLNAVTTGTSITASYNPLTGVLTLTGSDTLAHYQQVLDSVTYSSTSDNPTNFGTDTSRTISWVVNDGTLPSTTQTTALSITPADDAPVLSVAANAFYSENSPPVTLSSAATVSDLDNQNLATATVSISSGFLAGDVLNAVTTGTSITASYNPLTGVLTLTGSDTLAHYQQVLDSVTYSSTSDNPTNFGTDTSRTISWVVNDGTLPSTTQTTALSITPADDAPVLSVAANAFYSENSPPVTLSSAATVSDLDNQNLATATVSISSGFLAGDVLNAVTTGTSITASYNPLTGVLTLTGSDTLAHYQQVLDSVTYSSTSDNPTNFGTDTSRTISWVVNDGTLPSTTQTTALSITPADDAPVLSVAANAFYSENSPPVTLSSAATVSDLDNQNLATATVSISSGFLAGDVLNAVTTGTSITASYNPLTGVLTLTGSDTLAHYQQVLDSVTYSSTSDNPTNFGTDTSRTISWVVNDGTLPSTTQTTALSITPADDAPVLSVAANAFYSENSPPVTLSSAATVSDLDNQNLATATVSISSGFLAGDVLNAVTTGTSITASYNPLTGVLTLTGSDTLAHYQQVLDSVTYSSTSDNPTNFGTDTSRTISWVVNDGTLPSTTQTTALSITPADDAPVLSVAANAFYSENSPPVTLSSAATVSDLDNQNLATATVSISSGFLAGDVLNAVTTGTSITASYNPLTGVLTLTGSDTLAHYQQVLDSVTYSSTSDNPTNFGTDTSRTISWVVNDGTLPSTTQTTALSITPADDAPVLSVAANAFYSENSPPVTLSSAATVSDLDNQNLATATVSISSGFLAGDVLNAVTTGYQHHGELQSVDGRADPDGQRHAGALPAGARQRHLLFDQRQSDQLSARIRAGRSRGW